MMHFTDEIYPFNGLKSYRKCSRGFVFDEHNRVAMMHIVSKDEFGERDHYELPGGGRIGNETYANCFWREAGEELGLLIYDPEYLTTITNDYNLLGCRTKAKIFYARKRCDFMTFWTPLEKKLFAGIEWRTIDEWIDYLEKNLGEGVNYLVQRRDLYLFRLLKDTLLLN